MDTRPVPVTASDRHDVIDFLRGFAVLGILVMNIQSFAMPFAAYFNPTALGPPRPLDFTIWMTSHLFFDQKFMTIFSILFGAGILAYVLLTYFTEGSLPGFPFLASLTAIFGGAQLFSLGVLGEYVAQVFQRSMHRPTYAVRTITERHTAQAQTEFPDGPDSRAEQSPYGVYHGSHDDAG